jgi:inhibitor of KinA sporulation pathway (predicted exonuclease)
MAKKLDKVLVIDIEATCWETEKQKPSGEESEIIEIGLALYNVKTGEVEKSESIIIKPKRSKVSDFCTKLTTLTQDIVDKGTSFPAACEKLMKEYNTKNITCASFGDYDRLMFIRECKNYALSYPLSKSHMNIKNIFALQHKLDREISMPAALDKIKETLDGTHHRGVDDAVNIAKILKSILTGA